MDTVDVAGQVMVTSCLVRDKLQILAGFVKCHWLSYWYWVTLGAISLMLFLLNPLQPSGHYMYRQFNIQQFYVLPTQCIYVFCVDLRTNSDYFPIQHYLTGFYNRDLTLYSPVVTICTASLTFSNSTFCPHTIFMCFVLISEQTAIFFPYTALTDWFL